MNIPKFLFSKKEIKKLKEKNIVIKENNVFSENYLVIPDEKFELVFECLDKEIISESYTLNEKINRSFIIRAVSQLFNIGTRVKTTSDKLAYITAALTLANYAPNEAARLLSMSLH